MSTLTTMTGMTTPTSGAAVVIHGTTGNDTLEGGAGDDYLYDEIGVNRLLGGAGDDTIIGSGIINGGLGDDKIIAAGDASGNVYQYARGDGFDTILARGNQAGLSPQGVLQFGQGVTPASVMLVRDDDHLSFYLGPNQQVTLLNWFNSPAFQLEQVSFTDGTTWNPTQITGMDISVLGTGGDDVIHGYDGNNLIHAGPGDDYVLDGKGNNILHGGQGDDTLMGCGVLDGGFGNDTLLAAGNAAHNIYFFDIGDGRDTLYAHGDNNPGHPQGTVAFGDDLDPSRLWFRRKDNDLAVTLVGSREGVTIKDWYQGVPNQVDHFLSGGDKILSHEKVDGLVQAMAAFAAPMAGSSTLSDAVSQALAPVLAASWTAAASTSGR